MINEYISREDAEYKKFDEYVVLGKTVQPPRSELYYKTVLNQVSVFSFKAALKKEPLKSE